jgi:hypothetical protein
MIIIGNLKLFYIIAFIFRITIKILFLFFKRTGLCFFYKFNRKREGEIEGIVHKKYLKAEFMHSTA